VPYLDGRIADTLVINAWLVREKLAQIELELEQSVDVEKVLTELFALYKEDDNVEEKIDYYLLDLSATQCNGALYEEFILMLNFIREVGNSVYREIKQQRLYANNTLPYVFCNYRNGSIFLRERSFYYAKLRKELS
jgi:hypothetical protein